MSSHQRNSKTLYQLDEDQEDAIYRKYGHGDKHQHKINPVIRSTGNDIQQHHRRVSSRKRDKRNTRSSKSSRMAIPTPQELENSKKLMSHQVQINVGGTIFNTTFGTLLKCDFFQKILPTKVEDDGVVYEIEQFIDRCPEVFRQILRYLRSNQIDLDKQNRRKLLSEAQFYGIEKLIKIIQKTPIKGGYIVTGVDHPLDIPLLDYTDLPSQVNILCHNRCSISIKGGRWLKQGRHYCRFILIPSDNNMSYRLRIGGEGCFIKQYAAERPDLRLSLANQKPLIEKERSEEYQLERARDERNSSAHKTSSGAYTKGIIPTSGMVSLMMCIDVESRHISLFNTETKVTAFVRDVHSVSEMMWRPFWNVNAEKEGPFKFHVDIFEIEARQFERMFRRHQIPNPRPRHG